MSNAHRLEHVRRRLVVRRRDTFSEVAIRVVHRRTVPQKTSATPTGFRALRDMRV
jgi:hypothetical protein